MRLFMGLDERSVVARWIRTDGLLWLFFAALAFSLGRSVGPFDWRCLLAAFCGWYLADFASGAVHMYMDYRPCRPGQGLADLYFYAGSRESDEFQAMQGEVYARIGRFERIVYDFKKHHPMPDLLGRHGLFHLMRAPTVLITLPLSLVFDVVVLAFPTPVWVSAGVVVLLLGASMSQYFHGSLHREHNAWPVRWMRRLGLLMRPAAHVFHHDTLTRDFSVINGWSNPLLNEVAAILRRHGLLDEAGLEPT